MQSRQLLCTWSYNLKHVWSQRRGSRLNENWHSLILSLNKDVLAVLLDRGDYEQKNNTYFSRQKYIQVQTDQKWKRQ